MNRMNAIFIIALGLLSSEALGIKITKILVPKFVNAGDNPKLFCDFDLEDDKLSYVKWYKDGNEISKMVPNQLVQTQETRGIEVDKHETTLKTIVLKDVSLFSSGLYKCKVASNERLPRVHETGVRVMLVVDRPSKVEVITSKNIYTIGEKLEAKCVSYLSNPVAFISWNVDGKSISSPQHESGKTDAVILNEFLTGIQARQNDFKGTKSDKFLMGKNSSLQLSFKVQEKSLKNGIKLKCLAHVGDIYVPASRQISVIQSTNNAGRFTGIKLYIKIFVLMLLILK